MNEVTEYFLNLGRYVQGLLDRLPIDLEPQPIDAVMGRIKPTLDNLRIQEVGKLGQLSRPRIVAVQANRPVGQNTIGLLADRLTILAIKAWNLRHKRQDEGAARLVFDQQMMDIARAMEKAQPGHPDLLKKVTTLSTNIPARTWEEAFYGLVASNILLWEAQEVLYLKDLDSVKCDELRSYIKWFSYGNIDRNLCIGRCEVLFWEMAPP